MTKLNKSFPASFDIDYPGKLDRLTTLFRVLLSIPALIILSLLTDTGSGNFMNEKGKEMSSSGGGIMIGLFLATALLIVFRQRYPRWWFDFALELNRFSSRVSAYLFLLTDKYPSTVEAQTVRLNMTYPDVTRDLNQWLPLVKWLLVIPHIFILIFLSIGAVVATIIAWFAILFTGRYPQMLFDYVVGVGRWIVRVDAYAFTLITDMYPPFSLK